MPPTRDRRHADAWRGFDRQHVLGHQGIPADQLVSMFPIGRMGRPEELVAAVRYLTGTTLVLDGGYTAQ